MTSCSYSDVFSRFYAKATAYDLVELTEQQSIDFLCSWLSSAAAKPYVRKLFKTFTSDMEIQEIKFEMNQVIDEESDLEFVYDILSLGMLMEWLRPHINNYNNLAQVYGSKEEKFYSQSSHLAGLRALFQQIQVEQRQLISDRGSMWNSYLNGES